MVLFDREPRSDRGLKNCFFVFGGVVVGYGQLSILQVVRLNSSQMISFLA